MQWPLKRTVLLAILLAMDAPAVAGTIEGRVRSRDTKRDLSNFVLYVDDLQGPFPPSPQTALMDQRGLQFIPHVLPILVGTTVEFANSDPLAHNVFSISPAKRFNLGLYNRGVVRRVRFDLPGVVEVLCNVHQEMSAYILVLQNPYFARAAADGSYRISGVPVGSHRLHCWQERVRERTRTVQVPATGTIREEFVAD